MKTLAIIPARGGSKGVPRKNIKPLGGKPLIAYAIEAAQQSTVLTRVLTSTDDDEIAEVARAHGCDVLMRGAELAADTTPMIPVIQDVLRRVEAEDGSYDYVVLLQPTTPLRTAADIDAAATLLQESGADSVVSVTLVEDYHPARMYRKIGERLEPYDAEPKNRLRQSLPEVYHRNGAVYACRRALIDTHETLVGPDTRPYVMDREVSVNIDDPLDFAFAEYLVGQRADEGAGER